MGTEPSAPDPATSADGSQPISTVGERLAQALELELPQRPEDMLAAAAGHDLDELRRQDLAVLGSSTEASGLDDGIARVVVSFARFRLAAADADAELHLVRALPVLGLHQLLHRHRTGDRGRGCREGSHDAGTHAFHLAAVVFGDGPSQRREVSCAQVICGLEGGRMAHLRGTRQVRK